MKVLLNTLVSVAATIAVIVPTAGAAVRPDDRSGARGPGAVAQPELWLDPSIAAAVAKTSRSELWVDPALAEVVRSATVGTVRPDDRVLRVGAPLASPTVTPVDTTDSFQWGEAGIGAGAIGGILALVLGAIVLARRARRQIEPA